MWPLAGGGGQAAFSAAAGSFSNERQNRSAEIFFRDSEHAGEVELKIVARQSALTRSATGIWEEPFFQVLLSSRFEMETLVEESKPRGLAHEWWTLRWPDRFRQRSDDGTQEVH